MLVKYREHEIALCPALVIIISNLVNFCEKFRLPLNIEEYTDSTVTFSTLGWTEQLVHKYMYHATKDYSDLGLISEPLCTLNENSIKIVVNPNMSVEKFSKE